MGQDEVESCDHRAGDHVNTGQVLDQVEVELAQLGEHDHIVIHCVMIFTNTDPGIDHTELLHVSTLHTYQAHVYIKVNALQAEFCQIVSSTEKNVSKKTAKYSN